MEATVPTSNLSLADVFGQAVSTYKRHFLLFVSLFLLAAIPEIVRIIEFPNVASAGRAAPALAAFGLAMLSLLLRLYMQGVVLQAAYRDLVDQSLDITEIFGRTPQWIWRYLGLAILIGLATIIGIVLLIVPGVMILVANTAATGACLIENKGPIESMKRSWWLTKGQRWRIIGILLAALVAFVIAGGILGGLIGLLGVIGRITVIAYIPPVTSAIFGSFAIVMNVVLYHELRVIKEGVGADRVSAVFD